MFNANVITKSLLWLVTVGQVSEAAKAMQFSQSYQDHLKVMTSLIDDFYDPCEDFFQHACGYYDTQVAPVAPFMYNKEAAVRFFENNRANFSTTGGLLLNGLYESCKEKKWNTSQWKDIDFLAEFAKWPFLHYQWEDAGIETPWPHLAARLTARGVPLFFDIFFARNTIYVSPVDIVCPGSQQDIKTMIMSPATSVVNNQVTDIISSELYFFCKELTEGLPASLESPDEAPSVVETNEFFSVFLSTLSFTSDEVDNARKIQIRTARLEEILAVIRGTDSRIVINFIIWKMIEALEYNDCFRLTEEFEPLLLSEYWNWNVFEPKLSKNVALASYLFHTTRFQKRRKDMMFPKDWASFLDKRLRQKDLNMDRVIKNYANKQLSTKTFESNYSGIEMQRDSFYSNYFNMKSRQLRLSFLQDNYIDKEDSNHPAYFVQKFLNFVIVTIEDQPLFHYFATEGFDLWYNSGLLYSTDDMYAAIDCLGRQSEVYAEEYLIFADLMVDQMEAVLRFNRAFYESFSDYLFWLEGEKFSFAEDHMLEQFNLKSSRILFYSIAQLHCGRDDTTYARLINRSFMNTLEFQDAFECDVEVPMNPTMKCVCRNC